MNIKLKHIALGTLMCVAFTNAQDQEISKANDTYNDYAFMDAIGSYEGLLKKGYTKEEIYKNLGNSHYMNAEYKSASNWYEKLFQIEGSQQYTDEMYRYAQSLKSLEDYSGSDQWMRKLEAIKSSDNRAAKFENNVNYLSEIDKASGRYQVKSLSINSKESDYAPSFLGDQLIFSTARDTGLTGNHIHKWNNKPFSNIYQASLSGNDQYVNASGFSKALNTKAHESSAVFTKDGKTVYFTRNNDTKGNFSRDKDGVSRLKLYRGTLQGDSWTNITELPFNSDNYSVAHPALSPSEDKLYFASDMAGTLGASDIFVVDINSNGGFGVPKNLGSIVNTESRETFPFVSEDNLLYFASDGHPGLGGLDVFATELTAKNGDYQVKNIGRPVNSKEDDFSFVINGTTKKGFFASNRDGGKGDDDIYAFTESEPLAFKCESALTGIVKNKENGTILPNATVRLLNQSGKQMATTVADAQGKFNMPLDCDISELTAIASMSKFEEGRELFTPEQQGSQVELLLTPIKVVVAPREELAKALSLRIIYFDFDKDFIRSSDARPELDRVVDFMNQHPTIKVAIESHTDSRGNDSYNQELSDRRANSTMDYIISKGISSQRLTAKGYGESQLTNSCSNGSACDETQHDLNRRSEFVIQQ